MNEFETYLVLKYGTLDKAYHRWINSPLDDKNMLADEYNAINRFFAEISLRDRLNAMV